MEKKYPIESDARQTPPTFNEMVELIKKLFTDYLEDVLKSPPSEIEKSWQRYKILNHLYQDEKLPGLPPLPEPILNDDDVKAWEADKKDVHDRIIANQVAGMPLEEAIYQTGYVRGVEFEQKRNQAIGLGLIATDDAHEKETMMQAFGKVRQLFESREWIMEGRGSYPYNDDRYKEEVRYMYDEFEAIRKDTWANIKSKSFEYRQQIIADYLKENQPANGSHVESSWKRLYENLMKDYIDLVKHVRSK